MEVSRAELLQDFLRICSLFYNNYGSFILNNVDVTKVGEIKGLCENIIQ